MSPGTASKPAPAPGHWRFHTFLSELNPLQYIPVIGTIYRAITGDIIPEPVRDAGSLLVSGLIAGPIGIAMNIGELVAEKVTGLDPEKIGDEMLAKIGLRGPQPARIELAQQATPAQASEKPAKAEIASAWSASQLAAYGVTASAGDLKLGALQGADVLNSIELDRLQVEQATARYAATAASTAV